MAFTNDQIVAQNFKDFYDQLKPYLNGMAPDRGFTPVGSIIALMGNEAPQNYLICDGSVYSIEQFSELADFFEDQFGSKNYFGGDGTATFAVPDLRGEFLRGAGTNSHTDQGSGANVGVHQDGTLHNQAWGATNKMVYGSSSSIGGSTEFYPKNVDFVYDSNSDANSGAGNINTRVLSERGHYTSRPTNTSVLYCIAYCNFYIERNYDLDKPVEYNVRRWLRFDPLNKKGVIIKGGTKILLTNKVPLIFKKDTALDFSSALTTPGADYFIFISEVGEFSVVLDKSTGVGIYIGRFHTLCANAGTLTMVVPDEPSSGVQVGDYFLVKPYDFAIDPDFYNFYNKPVTAVTASTPYDVITCTHPLSGFTAGDILPESIFCDSFKPDAISEDAMVYDKTMDIFVDVYLQSGTGRSTKSMFNQAPTNSRQQVNHLRDLETVGKRLLCDAEFFSIAIGSNECTVISGAAIPSGTGGHSDSNLRRMISAIGCEDCCGVLSQWLSDVTGFAGGNWVNYDGKGSFGKSYGDAHTLLAGGNYDDTAENCGSGSRVSVYARSTTVQQYGARGCASLSEFDNGYSSVSRFGNGSVTYSTEEQVIGRWIDGKPIYQKTVTGTVALNSWFEIGVTEDIVVHNIFGCVFANSDGGTLPVSYVNTGNYYLSVIANTSTNKGKFTFMASNNYASNYTFELTFQYAKITD